MRQILKDNNLDKRWTPTRPILFCHSPVDQDVAYQQTVSAMDYLGAEILKAGGAPQKLLVRKPLGFGGIAPSHIQGIPFALGTAFDWIYNFEEPAP